MSMLARAFGDSAKGFQPSASHAQPPVTPQKTLLQASGYKAPSVQVSTQKAGASSNLGAHSMEKNNTGNHATVESGRAAQNSMKAHLDGMKQAVADVAKSMDGVDQSIFADTQMGNGTALGMCFGAAAAGLTGGGSLAMVVSHTGEANDAVSTVKADKSCKSKAEMMAKIEDKIRTLAKNEVSATGQGTNAEHADNSPKTPLQNVVAAMDAGHKLEDIMFTDVEQLPEYKQAGAIVAAAETEANLSSKVENETAKLAQLDNNEQGALNHAIKTQCIDSIDVGLVGSCVVGCVKVPVEPKTLKCVFNHNEDTIKKIASANPAFTNAALEAKPPEVAQHSQVSMA